MNLVADPNVLMLSTIISMNFVNILNQKLKLIPDVEGRKLLIESVDTVAIDVAVLSMLID